MTAASLLEERLSHSSQAFQGGGHAFQELLETSRLLMSAILNVTNLVQVFSDVAVGNEAVDIRALDLRDVIQDALSISRLRSEEGRYTFALKGADERTGTAIWFGDRQLLIRALVHVMNNIADHAYPGSGGQVEITVSRAASSQKPALAISVQDFGVGIDTSLADKLFDPFFTTARGRSHKGLGLAVFYNIITGPLQGQINLRSTLGSGTTVTLTVPKRLVPREEKPLRPPLRS
jgi:signal transduction histidine kinase